MKTLILTALVAALLFAVPVSAAEITVASVCRKAQTEGPAGADRQYAKVYCAFLTRGSIKLAASAVGLNQSETIRQTKKGAAVFNRALDRSTNVQ